ncbi:MAG: pyruvate kinase alpha/beta domain-containing protein [Chloroflexota bacterium]|nr:pyruvate kinase alpha/beta domain-containing protein [Chloroflexota bacterium]
MSEIKATTVYFEKPGPTNTTRTLEIASQRAAELGIRTILVATTSGATGAQAAQMLAQDFNLIVITHSAGFREPDTQELTPENRVAIEATEATILTCQHAFGGVGRAVRKKLGTYELEEIIAYTLRNFGQGVKVCAEMAVMAADAGLVRTDEPCVAIAGTGHGADTALIVLPTNAQTFFDLRVVEFLCLPSPLHPAFSIL